MIVNLTDPAHGMSADPRGLGESLDWTGLPPHVVVSQSNEGVVFFVLLPHVDSAQIALGFVDGVLTMRAAFDQPAASHHELVTDDLRGYYFRRFGVGFTPDRARVEARLDGDLLTIVVPEARCSRDYSVAAA